MFKKTIATFALIATLAAAATVAMPTSEAEAKGGRKAAFAIGAFTGLAVGAMAAHSHRRHYHGHHAGPAYHGRPAPWTRAWYRYCHNRYRSFNPHTGYFTTYSGHKRFCR
ncbi:BA14K-like protein [Cohaesibacter sp. ES.047]|uniref:BA14K family protein n=1 Tax=Cohaesibacter sp. ES.047 TaxID=1798205 RepID=UPI000BB6E971|nr:BA14K family protein [Cohaesibacter sp. ES.047]SNY94195.1 BA14K-like protein [Cohaesibacter sp. ES.047]